MSMPEFPNLDHLTKEQAINSILTSIAMEEAALSHIINAEGEKIQFALAHKNTDIDKVIAINESVSSLLEKVFDLQLVLKSKLRLTKEFISIAQTEDKPEKPHKPYRPPC